MKIDFAALAKDSGYLCFDVEFDAQRTQPFAAGFTIHGCGFSSFDGKEIVTDYITDQEEIKRIVDATFQDDKVQIIAHNAKFDLNCLKRANLYPGDPINLRCSMVGYNILDGNLQSSDYGLKPTILRDYGHKMEDYKTAAAKGLDTDQFYKYANEDVYWELKLYMDMEDRLKRFWDLYTKILMPSLLAFSDMECFGMYWDIEQAEDFYQELYLARERLEKKIFEKIGRVNLNSSQQLGSRLFTELGYTTKYSTKGKNGHWCLDAKVLDQLARHYPVCNWIRAYRSCEKLIGTYLEPAYRQYTENEDNRIHSSYWLISRTGRTRCSDLNNQNLPVRVGADLGDMAQIFENVKIRRACAAPKGKKLIVVDANQIELRLAGHIMQEKDFINAYRDWKCFACDSSGSDVNILHTCPKCGELEFKKAFSQKKGFWQGRDLHTEVLDYVPIKIRSKLNRDHGKALNFAIIYNAGGWRLHFEHPMLQPEEWQEAVDNIMRHRPNAKRYHKQSEAILKGSGRRETIFGREYYVPKSEFQFKGQTDRKKFKHSLNQFINAPVQSAGADFGHVFVGKLRKFFIDKDLWGTSVKLVNWVHDECVLEVDEDLAEQCLADTIYVMEHSVGLDVPIRAEGQIVDTWDQAK